jgi:hypothetical protein
MYTAASPWNRKPGLHVKETEQDHDHEHEHVKEPDHETIHTSRQSITTNKKTKTTTTTTTTTKDHLSHKP